jgi:hypothetical protein
MVTAEEAEALPELIKSKIFSSRERQAAKHAENMSAGLSRSSSAVVTLGIAEHAWQFSEGR